MRRMSTGQIFRRRCQGCSCAFCLAGQGTVGGASGRLSLRRRRLPQCRRCSGRRVGGSCGFVQLNGNGREVAVEDAPQAQVEGAGEDHGKHRGGHLDHGADDGKEEREDHVGPRQGRFGEGVERVVDVPHQQAGHEQVDERGEAEEQVRGEAQPAVHAESLLAKRIHQAASSAAGQRGSRVGPLSALSSGSCLRPGGSPEPQHPQRGPAGRLARGRQRHAVVGVHGDQAGDDVDEVDGLRGDDGARGEVQGDDGVVGAQSGHQHPEHRNGYVQCNQNASR
mmetsp:Transcript_1025/g.3003  ORF Transcript_1025/g.3003 Transcript_1025/m.3003 type:complete len:280 (-) Transcript_1025:188-1027(-)